MHATPCTSPYVFTLQFEINTMAKPAAYRLLVPLSHNLHAPQEHKSFELALSTGA